MARISITQHNDSEGRLKEIYDDIVKKRGKLAEVHKIQSLRPESIVHHMDLYLEIMFSRSQLSRAEREMIAVVVSSANGCSYCKQHHGQALLHYWKDQDKISKLQLSRYDSSLSTGEKALCEYARSLTLNPGDHEKHDFTQSLKNAGFSDHAILDATLVVAYFNFVNRIVLSLGVELETDDGAGYNY